MGPQSDFVATPTDCGIRKKLPWNYNYQSMEGELRVSVAQLPNGHYEQTDNAGDVK